MDGNYTLSDIVTAMGGNRNNGGLGNNDLFDLLVLFALFGGGWGNGFGGFGGGGGAGFQGYATRADINEGFALNGLQTGITAIQQGLCDSTYAITGAIKDCCCTTQRSIDGVNFNMATGFANIANVMNTNTRDILENQNTNTRAILDFLVQDKIATLTAENQNLKLSASQANQNAVLMAAMDANKAEILRRTGAECPTPAYVVQPPTPVNFPVNGCGQVQFGNYGWNNGCGCGCG